MIYQIYPTKDATIYERKPELNSGIDSILEITKTVLNIVSGSTKETKAFASRILMQFDYSQLSPLQEAGFNLTGSDSKYAIKLYSTEEKQFPSSFTLEVDMLSDPWTMGLGKYEYIPNVTNGVSWLYRNGKTNGTIWTTESINFDPLTTGSWNVNPGGGDWHFFSDTYYVTKSFEYNELKDVDVDITKLVREHFSGSLSPITNNGFLIRRISSEEKSTDDEMQLKFFSSDTNTIYLPHLQVKWNDWSFNTGSLTELSADENVIYFKNLKYTYNTNERVKFRLVGRPKYPVKTFSTSSIYSTEYFLPASSSYSIEDLHTKEVVIPHDYIYTRISCDATSSYFNFWVDSLQPERWYKMSIRSKYSNGDVRIYNKDFIFKVEREV